MRGSRDDVGTTWISVEELPPTEAEKRRDRRQFTLIDVVFYGFTVALTLSITYPSGILADPLYLGAYLAMMAGFAALFYWRHRTRAKTWGRNPYSNNSRVGSTSTALYVEDFSGRREIPWSSASTPGLGTWRGRQLYVISYRTSEGVTRELRLTAARMAAILRLPNHPLWNLPPGFLTGLEGEYRSRGVPFPLEPPAPADQLGSC